MRSGKPLYREMRDYLMDLVEKNRADPNYRLPSEKQLADAFGASRISAKHAFDTLVDEGVIFRQQGRGSFIVPDEAGQKTAASGALRDEEDCIALIVPFVSTIFMSDIIEGIQQELRRNGLHFVMFVTDNDQQREMRYLRQAQEQFKGAILFPGAFAKYHEEMLRVVLNRFPIVQIDRYLPGLDLSYVACDHRQATYRATKALFSMGHERVGFVGHLLSHASSVTERFRGFDQAVTEFDPAYPSFFKLNVEDSLKDFDDLFRRYMTEAAPTAIISSSHLHAPTIIRVLREMGKEKEVTLMLYDNELILAKDFLEIHPYIIDQQPKTIGQTAAALLCDLALHEAKPSMILVPERIYQL